MLGLYRAGVSAALSATALPYGYTLTIWSSGELVRTTHRTMGLAEIFLFILGAVTAFGLLRIAVGDVEEREAGFGGGHVVRAGVVHLAAIFAAAGVAAVAATVPGLAAWPLVPLCATSCYLALVAVEQSFEVHPRD